MHEPVHTTYDLVLTLVAQQASCRDRFALARVCRDVEIDLSDLTLRTPVDVALARAAWRKWRSAGARNGRRRPVVHSWRRRRIRTDETPVLGM